MLWITVVSKNFIYYSATLLMHKNSYKKSTLKKLEKNPDFICLL